MSTPQMKKNTLCLTTVSLLLTKPLVYGVVLGYPDQLDSQGLLIQGIVSQILGKNAVWNC